MRFLLPELKDNGDKVEVRKALLDAEKSINEKNDSQDAQIATNTSNITTIFTTLSALKTVVITGNYTLQNDDSQIFINTDSALTITVPASFPVNRPFRVKRISSGLTTNAVTVAFTGATIYGASSIAIFGNAIAKTSKNLEQFDFQKITASLAELIAGEDSGANANGNYVNSYNKKTMQWGVKSQSLACTGVAGAIFYSPPYSISLPYTYKTGTIPVNSFNFKPAVGSPFPGGTATADTTSTIYYIAWHFQSSTISSVTQWTSHGYWI